MTRSIETAWADLERLANRCTGGDPWYTADDLQGRQTFGQFIPQDRAFIAAANPATVLELIAAARAGSVGRSEATEPRPFDPAVVGELADHLMWVLPMAKGYAAANRVGSNAEIVAGAEAALAKYAPQTVQQPSLSTEYGANDLRSVAERVRGRLAVSGSYAWLNRSDVEALLGSADANQAVGSWLSAALDDPAVCEEMKRDIREWFGATQQTPVSTETKGEGDWIEWTGGENPVPGRLVEVRFRDLYEIAAEDRVTATRPSENVSWKAWGTSSDIIAYRIVTPIEGEGHD